MWTTWFSNCVSYHLSILRTTRGETIGTLVSRRALFSHSAPTMFFMINILDQMSGQTMTNISVHERAQSVSSPSSGVVTPVTTSYATLAYYPVRAKTDLYDCPVTVQRWKDLATSISYPSPYMSHGRTMITMRIHTTDNQIDDMFHGRFNWVYPSSLFSPTTPISYITGKLLQHFVVLPYR